MVITGSIGMTMHSRDMRYEYQQECPQKATVIRSCNCLLLRKPSITDTLLSIHSSYGNTDHSAFDAGCPASRLVQISDLLKIFYMKSLPGQGSLNRILFRKKEKSDDTESVRGLS